MAALTTTRQSSPGTSSAIWNIFKIAGTRGADVSRCHRGAIQLVQRAA